jgi:glycosyltransferase involved in cell wall biosynthesis
LVPIPNFVDAHRFRPGTSEERSASRAELNLKPTDFAILFVGHFSKDKRPGFLFDALLDTLVSNPSIHLIMVGEAIADHFEVDRSLLARIQAKASALGIHDQLRWIRQHQRMENLYMAVDLFALPSIREGMPNALAEAMCAQLPVVATKLQGVTDWMLEGGKCGRLVPNEHDPSSLTTSIVELIANAVERRSLGAHARRKCIEEFSPHKACEKVWRVYQSLKISGHR